MIASACDPAAHRPHSLHGPGRAWPQINCALDHWVELLAVLGREPAAVAGVALAADAWGDHWEMIELDPGDLADVLGVRRREMSPWRPLADHVRDQLGRGVVLSVEADAWWLPDTAATSYRSEHVKTSIMPLALDETGLTYLHNDGMFTAHGDDVAGIFSADPAVTQVPRPYVDAIAPGPLPTDWVERAVAASRRHLAARPTDPVTRLEAGMIAAFDAVLADPDTLFHPFAFGTCRQLGGTAQLAAGHVRWLAETAGLDPAVAAEAAEGFDAVATEAVAVQFRLARTVARRRTPQPGLLAAAADAYATAMAATERLLEAG